MVHQLRNDPGVEIIALITTLNEPADRVAMHAVRRTLLEAQARELHLPLWTVPLPFPCSNEIYESRFQAGLKPALQLGATHLAFGDLLLEDVRRYRCNLLKETGLVPWFPIWCGESSGGTSDVARRIPQTGFKAIITCIDPRQLSPDFLGRSYDTDFLQDLPDHVDPCGENGEFHTFCHAGPIFSHDISVRTGTRLERDGFWFLDLEPGEAGAKDPRD